jgi:SAM-dependent methyltransferase
MTTTPASANWFAAWFDSPYYPLLYQHRSEAEAHQAVHNLASYLRLDAGAPVLDLACGSGRHSRTLADMGYRVTGLDLSPQSIERAQQLVPEAAFRVQDMRQLDAKAQFQAVFNFFTSFGYFTHEADNLAVLNGVQRALVPGGHLLLDFFNANRVLQHIAQHPTGEFMSPTGPVFRWHKQVHHGVIVKDIEVEDGPELFHYQERVQALRLPDFEALFAQTGLRLVSTLGGYDAQPFEEATSERLIVIATTV